MKNGYELMTAASERVGKTKREGDEVKWKLYKLQTKAGQLEWRRREGHAEFCRLQRLEFHRFI